MREKLRFRERLGRLGRYLLDHGWFIGITLLMTAVQLFLYWMLQEVGRDNFFKRTRDIFLWGIALTLVYKECIVLIMALTPDKTKLDRCFIWHTQSVGLLFMYAFVTIENPKVAILNPVAISWIWFNIWVQILVSAGAVLYYLYIERFHPVVRYLRTYGWPGRKTLMAMLRGGSNDGLARNRGYVRGEIHEPPQISEVPASE